MTALYVFGIVKSPTGVAIVSLGITCGYTSPLFVTEKNQASEQRSRIKENSNKCARPISA